jgi:hypothetical protein
MRIHHLFAGALLAALLLPALPSAAGDKPTEEAKKSKKLIHEAEKKLKECRALYTSISDAKQDASMKQQTARLECVLEHETEAKGLLNIAKDALKAMRTALANSDHVSVGHEKAKIDLAHDKIMKASAAADLCGDDIRNYDGPTILEVEEPPEEEKK